MHVNETRSDDTSGCIDGLFSCTAHRTNRHDAAVLNANISSKPRLAAAVDHRSITDNEVIRHTASYQKQERPILLSSLPAPCHSVQGKIEGTPMPTSPRVKQCVRLGITIGVILV